MIHVFQGLRYIKKPGLAALIIATILLASCPMPTPDPIQPPVSRLAAPDNFVVAARSGEVILTWDAVTGAENYHIYRGGERIVSDTNSTTLTYTDTNLTNDTAYTYTVRALDSNGLESGDSVEITAIPSDAPPAPGNFTFMFTTDLGEVELNWEEVSGAATYHVYRDGRRIGTDTVITDSTYTDRGRADETLYTYTVRSVDDISREGVDSEPVNVTLPLPPGAPENLSFTFTTTLGEVILNWNVLPAAVTYQIYRDTTRLASGITGTTYTDVGRTHGTEYTYEVRAVDAYRREGTDSAEMRIIPPAELDPPGNFRGEIIGRFSQFLWDAVDGAVSYNVYRDGVLYQSPTDTRIAPQFEGADGSTQIFIVRTVDVYGREGNDSVEVRLILPAPNDFRNLGAAGNEEPRGIWSDGTTMWVVDSEDRKLYAYSQASKAYTPAADIDLDVTNGAPGDIWSDGTTIWVMNQVLFNGKIFAYNLSNGRRDATKDFNVSDLNNDNFAPVGIWSDKTPDIALADATMWVTDRGHNKVFAYNMESKARVRSKEFSFDAGNNGPRSIWSNGTTMWVLDFTVATSASKLYAYNLSDGTRDTTKEFTHFSASGNHNPHGLWSDGELLWVSDNTRDQIYAYNLETMAHTPE